MEPARSMQHSQEFSNTYPETDGSNSSHKYLFILIFILILQSTRGIFPKDLYVKMLKPHGSSPSLTLCDAQIDILDLITLAMLGEWYKTVKFSICELFSTFQYQSFWVQIFTSQSCFQKCT